MVSATITSIHLNTKINNYTTNNYYKFIPSEISDMLNNTLKETLEGILSSFKAYEIDTTPLDTDTVLPVEIYNLYYDFFATYNKTVKLIETITEPANTVPLINTNSQRYKVEENKNNTYSKDDFTKQN